MVKKRSRNPLLRLEINEPLHFESSTFPFTKKRHEEDDFSEQKKVSLQRVYIFYVCAFLVVFLFLARLFILTIVDGEKNRVLADENRIRLFSIEAVRGRIFDKNRDVIGDSQVVYILKNERDEKEIDILEKERLEREGQAGEDFTGPAGRIFAEVRRRYPLREAASHILGYVSVVTQDDQKTKENLSGSDKVGRLGIEATYDDFLRGKNGQNLVEVDAVGNKISLLGRREPERGRDVYLTVDRVLQSKVYEVLKRHIKSVKSKKGAVIIQDPKNGEVLALVSIPAFDPEDIGRSITNVDEPFFNRVVQGTYPPGSVFKIISALAGLESKAIDKNTEIEDVGEFYIGEFKFPNWYFLNYGRKDGILKIDRAIARSNDIFFYRVAEKAGLDNLRQTAIKFGFGQKTGIDLPEEALGLVPSREWKEATFNSGWFLGDTMHLGIGQGFMLTSPVQVNVVTSYMASGKLTKPYIVFEIKARDGDGEKDINFERKVGEESLVSQENFELVREGMRQACEKGGTGWPFFEAKYRVGCKTGTAERGLGNPHAWFTAFAPFDDPKLAITVIIEEGGEGSSVAGPVAKEILDWYFLERKIVDER